MTTDDRRGVFLPLWAIDDCGGNLRDALVLAQICWWLQPSEREDEPRSRRVTERKGMLWLYLTDEQLGEEIHVSADQVYRARKSLRSAGLIETAVGYIDGKRSTLTRPIRPAEREANSANEDGGSNRGPAVSEPSKPRPRGDLTAAPRLSPSIERGKNSLVESACAASPSESKKVDYDGSGDPPSVEAVRLKRLPFPPQFAECWNLYPKRCDHDKLGAYKAWRARVVEAPKAGVGRPERMGNLLWAVRGYVLDCEEEDRAEEFMKNASTFFGAANDSVLKYCARLARQRYADPDVPEVEPESAVRSCAPLVGVGAGTGPSGRNGASPGHTGASERTGT